MEREKNEIISLYVKNDEMQSDCIQLLQQKLALESKWIEQFKQLKECDGQSRTLLREMHDQNMERIEQLLSIISQKEIVIHLLKEKIAILEKEQN